MKSNSEMNLTEAAVAALREQGFSRRQFLKGSGALVVAFSVAEFADTLGIAPEKMLAQGGNTPQALDSWIAIGADGNVTVYTGRADMGQGTFTVQMQLAAEELSVPMNRIRMVECDTGMTPDQGTSSGSQCHPVNFNQENLAQACATAREALVAMAATRLGSSAGDLVVADGVVMHKSEAKRVTYGELIGGKRFDMTIKKDAKRKPVQNWTVLGRSVPRVDMPALATGRFEHVQNVRVPGMVHGRMVRPPSIGATLANVDESSVAGMPGNVKVVVKKNLVGVVADKPWQAIQAAEKLKVTWTPGPALPGQRDFYTYLRNHPGRRDAFSVNSKDVDAKLQAWPRRRSERRTCIPYQIAGSLGSSCAVADVKGSNATVWSSTQAVYPLRGTTAMVLGLQPQQVRVIYVRGSGCYGLNGSDAVAYDAAVLSQAVGKPVRVQLTRKDEMVWGENYGLPFVVDQQVALDASGNIVAWDYETWSATLGNRPGNNAPGNVASGLLLGFAPAAVAPRAQAPDPQNFDNGNNAVPAYVTGRVGGKNGGTGTVASERVLTHTIPSPFLTGPLRSPARLQNAFAQECFMDEVAAQVKADPVQYRLRHLSDQRLKDVITDAARQFNWDARPSPKAGSPRTGIAADAGRVRAVRR
jgi:CO/xanthine dehydrogenase Mo-binding subunit